MGIVIPSPGEIAAAVDFTWARCTAPARRCYPLFSNREEVRREYEARCGSARGGLLEYRDGGLKGVISFFTDLEAAYLQITGLYLSPDRAGAEAGDALLAYLDAEYGVFQCLVGLPRENRVGRLLFERHGYTLAEDSVELWLEPVDFRRPKSLSEQVCRVDDGLREAYLAWHTAHFSDIYWNADRLREDFSRWEVYAHVTRGRIDGGVFLRPFDGQWEIYGLEGDGEIPRALLEAALWDRPGRVLFLAERERVDLLAAAAQVGFRETGSYCCLQRLRR